jgi:hypothetical protein
MSRSKSNQLRNLEWWLETVKTRRAEIAAEADSADKRRRLEAADDEIAQLRTRIATLRGN